MNKRIKQNPVAWAVFIGDAISVIDQTKEPYTAAGIVKPLYEEPPKREWVGLTDEVIWLEYQHLWPFHPAEEPTLAKDIAKFARAIEAKLKEKNMEVEE